MEIKKSPYHNQIEIPILLTCGCETRWADGDYLWHVGQDVRCPKHGDVEVEEIYAPDADDEDGED